MKIRNNSRGFKDMKKKLVSIFILVLVLICFKSWAKDDDFVQRYPGGDYGLDVGAGYQLMPEGEFLPPSGYREDYKDTKYGPMTQRGFSLFQNFRFSDSKKAEDLKKKREQEREEKELIFQRAFQKDEVVEGEDEPKEEEPSPLWGFSKSVKK